MLSRWFTVLLVTAVGLLSDTNGDVIFERIGIPPPGRPDARAQRALWGTILQRLNHFDATDNRTWTMRYLRNGQFFKPGGPMFVFIGGEWEINEKYLYSGQMFDMAADHNGYMFYTEHRFYGKSYPTGDFSASSYKYHSADQALADLAYFIQNKKQTMPGLENSKVVVVGASYSASLATWARLKYPHLVTAAYASSGPLHAKQDFYEYSEVVSSNIAMVSPECAVTISKAIVQIEEAINDPNNVHHVRAEFKFCKPFINVEPHRSHFFRSLALTWGGIVQYAQPNVTIANACNELLNYKGSSLQKLGAFMTARMLGACQGNYDDYVNYLKPTAPTTSPRRSWLYQTCAEFGYFQTGSSYDQIFGRNFFVSFSEQVCKDIFGQKYNAAFIENGVRRTNIVYGSTNPQVTRVVSVHGTVDPWHAIGLLEDLSPEAPAILVKGTSHCADLESMDDDDSQEMREAKQRVKDLIAAWIK